MGFFKDILRHYGVAGRNALTNIKSTRSKLKRMINRRIFLLRCRSNQVYPAHIQNNVRCLYQLLPRNPKHQTRIDKIVNDLKSSVLNLEIEITCEEVTSLKSKLDSQHIAAKSFLPDKLVDDFVLGVNNQVCHNFKVERVRQKNKFERLCQQQNNFESLGSLSNIKNLSNTVIPEDTAKFLSLGPKHSVEPTNHEMSVKNILGDIEAGVAQMEIDAEEKDLIRNDVINAVTNFKANKKLNRVNNTQVKQFHKTKKFLRDNSHLKVLNADKGNIACVIDEEQYVQKMSDLVQDRNTYRIVDNDPTQTVERRSNALVKKLFDNNFISDGQRFRLNKYNSQLPKIYGNPKIHKTNHPLRPVVSCINGPTSNLAKLVDRVLKNFVTNSKFNLKNSKDLKRKISKLKIPRDYILASFDVESLFTNITKEAVISALNDYWDEIKPDTNISLEYVEKIIGFIYDNSYFSFKGKIYQQIKGSAMGNPASPSLAGLVMHKVLSKFLEKINSEIKFLYVYVDDIIALIHKDKLNHFLEVLNKLDINLKFTCEVEKDKKLPFLDILIINNEGVIEFDLYKKPTSSNRLLNFKSYHPLHQKVSIINQMLHKIYNLCTEKFVSKNIENLRYVLKCNNYPSAFINNVIRNFNSDKDEYKDDEIIAPEAVAQDNTKYIRAPYHKDLAPRFNRIFSNYNRKMAYYNTKTSECFFGNVKDRVEIKNQTEVVYQLNCSCGKYYIGQTGQLVSSRMQQHQRDVANKRTTTGLSRHITENADHTIDFDNVKIIDKAEGEKKRQLHEMYYIVNSKDNNLNIQKDFQTFNGIYNNVLKKFK